MSALRRASGALGRYLARRGKDETVGQIGDRGASARFGQRRASTGTEAASTVGNAASTVGNAATKSAVSEAAVSKTAVSKTATSVSASGTKKSSSIWKDYKQLSKLRLSLLVTVRVGDS